MKWTDTRREYPWKKIIIASLLLLIGVIIGVVMYAKSRTEKARQYAEESLQEYREGNYSDSMLAIRRAVQMAPEETQVVRSAASLAREAGSREEIAWRWRLIEISSDEKNELVELAAASLRHGEVEQAMNVLQRARDAGVDTPGFHSVAGAVAVARNDLASAEKAFARALKLDPNNPVHRLDLEIVHLQNKSAEVVKSAAASLEQLAATEGKTQVPALRALYAWSKDKGDTEKAIGYAQQLVQSSESSFSDQLLLLDLLVQDRPDQVEPTIERLKSEYPHDEYSAAALLEWLGTNGRQKESLLWYESLTDEFKESSPVLASVAASLAELGYWQELVDFLKPLEWENLEYLRHAYLALGHERLNDHPQFRAHWASAITSTNARSAPLLRLLKLAQNEKWKDEKQEVLWEQAMYSDHPNAALHLLYKRFQDERNTEALLEILDRMTSIDPDSLPARNNWIFMSLLLDRNPLRFIEPANSLIAEQPNNPEFLSTASFTYFKNNDVEKALQIITRLPESRLREPKFALYLALYLESKGDHIEAEKFYQLSLSAENLLPQELVIREKLGLRLNQQAQQATKNS